MIEARPLLAIAIALALPLAGCGRKAQQEEAPASGRVLEGTVSDAMIHTDQLRSEGPYAAPAGTGGVETARGGKPAAGRPKTGATRSPAARASAAPAATPASSPAAEPTPE
jgi:hypothetical protein